MKQMFDEAAVGVTDESTVVKVIESPDVAYLQVEVENSGAKDLTAFDVQFKDHPTGEFYTVLSGADYAAGAKAALVFMSADPSSLAAAGNAHLHLWIGSSVAVRFKANCTTAESTTLNIKATGAPNGASARSSGAGSISGFATAAKQPTLGTGVMAGSAPVTIATDDTVFGAAGTAADVDGNVRGQLRYIGETLATVTESAPVAASVIVAAGPTATALAANGTFVSSCIVVAKAGNISDILLGTSASQIVPIAPGGTFTIVCGQGRKTDLNDYYINGTAAEGVDVLYTTV